MKLMRLRSPLWSLFLVALLVGLPFLCSEVQARGGSFRGGAGGPGGAGGVGRPGGVGGVGGVGGAGGVGRPGGVGGAGGVVRPGGAVVVGGAGYRGPGYGGVAAGIAVGTVVATLPARAAALSVAGQRYYYDGSAYYQQCYQGTDVNYCVVPDPNQ